MNRSQPGEEEEKRVLTRVKSMCKGPVVAVSRYDRLEGGELVSGVKPAKKVKRQDKATKTGKPDHAGPCGALQRCWSL